MEQYQATVVSISYGTNKKGTHIDGVCISIINGNSTSPLFYIVEREETEIAYTGRTVVGRPIQRFGIPELDKLDTRTTTLFENIEGQKKLFNPKIIVGTDVSFLADYLIKTCETTAIGDTKEKPKSTHPDF